MLLECCLVSDTNRRWVFEDHTWPMISSICLCLPNLQFDSRTIRLTYISTFSHRYSAKSLLGHRFFRQIKKSSNLLNLLPNKTSLLDHSTVDDSAAAARQVETGNDLCPARCLSCEHCKYSGFIDTQFIRSEQPNDGDRTPVDWKF